MSPQPQLQLESRGRRHYVVGDTKPVRQTLKDFGLRWDPDAVAWWSGKKATAEAALQKALAEFDDKAEKEAKIAEAPKLSDPRLRFHEDLRTNLKRAGARYNPSDRSWSVPDPSLIESTKEELDRRDEDHRVAKASRPTGERWYEAKLVGEKSSQTIRRRLEPRGRGYKPPVDSYLGEVFRAGKRCGAVAGKVVKVVGAEANYTSEEQEDDMGVPGTPSGWWLRLHVVEASEDEAKPVLGAEAEREAKIAAAKAEKEAKERAWHEAFSRATEGLIQCTVVPRGVVRGEVVASCPDKSVRIRICKATLEGADVILEELEAHDDYRTYLWGPPDLVKRILLDYAQENQITIESARNWLDKYKGCHGEDLYQAVVDDNNS